MRVRCHILLCLILLAGGSASGLRAQSETQPLPGPGTEPIRFDHLTNIDGLSQQIVYTIAQDRNGFMWFGTQSGLNKYDGYRFTVYKTDPTNPTSPDHPGSNQIGSIYEDHEGMVWIGYRSLGNPIDRFDPATGTFTHFRPDPDDPGSPNGRVSDILEDQDGVLWFAGWGLNRFDRETDTFTHFFPDPRFPIWDPDQHALNWIQSLHEDRFGELWVGTRGGLFRFDRETSTFTPYLHDPADPASMGPGRVRAIYEDRQGTLWVGAWGLNRYDRETETFERFFPDPRYPNGEEDAAAAGWVNSVSSITEDQTGAFWVGTGFPGGSRGDGGLFRFDRGAGTFTAYRHEATDPYSLANDDVNALYEDRQGVLWIGTGRGIDRIDRTARLFDLYRHAPGDPNSLQGGLTLALHLARDGGLWVGTSTGVLSRLDRQTGAVTHLRHDPSDPASIMPGVIWDVYEDRRGRIWVGIGRGELNRLNPLSGRFRRYRHDPDDSTSLGVGRPAAILEDRAGTLWIGTNELHRYNPETDNFTRFNIGTGLIASMTEDQEGMLWLGRCGVGSGLSRFDPRTETFQHYPLPSCHWSVYERPQEPGIIWISSFEGLHRFDVRAETFTAYTTKNSGLPDDGVYCMVGDEAGSLWMSTNLGLARFHPDENTWQVFDMDDGLQGLEFDSGGCHRGHTGELFFGGSGGVNAIWPGDIFDNPNPPQVTFTGLRLFNEPVAPGPDGLLAHSIGETDALTLAHNQNDITLEYVGLHFRHPQKNQYAYKLEGYDDEWRAVGTLRTATYTNLPPGSYTFRVKASNSDGVWNEEGASLRITVQPPWWRTTWAYVLDLLLFAAGVFAVDRFQRRRLIRKERERAAIEQAQLRAEAAEAEARALEADNQRKKNVELLSEIGKEITASLDIDAIFVKLYDHVNELMVADSFGVGLYHADRHQIEYRLAIEKGKRYTPYMRDTTNKNQYPVWCIEHREVVFINDVEKEYSRYIDQHDDARRELEDGSLSEVPQSLIYLPLIAQDRVLGVITVQSFERDAYTEHDLNVLQSLASYTSIALDNADAYRQLGTTLDDLQTTQAQLIQSEKMASLGQLTAGIAHEIKNPLNFVNNFAEVNEELAGELRDALAHGDANVADLLDDLVSNARQIAKHGKRADRIVKSMMEHARGGSGERYHVAVNPFVEEYVNLSYHGMQAQRPDLKVKIERQYDEGIGTVEMSPQEMGRVLLNLLNNAFEAVHEHSQLHNGPYVPEVSVSTRRNGETVEIRVSDNGPGIDATLRQKIFEPFFTTKPTGTGTGLGLSLAYDIVTQSHGGTLAVESDEGEGATFIITLPISSSKP